MIKHNEKSRSRPEPTTFDLKDAADHAEAMRQAHLRTLLPDFKQCKSDEERSRFRGIVSRNDFVELEYMAETEA